jgi:hypothetical protein
MTRRQISLYSSTVYINENEYFYTIGKLCHFEMRCKFQEKKSYVMYRLELRITFPERLCWPKFELEKSNLRKKQRGVLIKNAFAG